MILETHYLWIIYIDCQSQYISRVDIYLKGLPNLGNHYGDVTMGAITSQITSLMIVYSTVYSGADQSKHQSSASLAFVWEIHRGPVNFPHKWPVTRKMFPFDDVIMFIPLWWIGPPSHNSIYGRSTVGFLASGDISQHYTHPWVIHRYIIRCRTSQ